jgi:hypothetical protein
MTSTAPLTCTLHPAVADVVPEPLRALRRWIVWRLEAKDGKLDKVAKDPRNPKHGGCLSWGDPSRWVSFEEALEAARKAGDGFGLGFIVGEGLVAIDLDDCLDAEGVAKAWARPLLTALDAVGAYLELSPRGRGLRAFVRGELPRAVKHPFAPEGDKLESWSHSRWVSITGRRTSEESDVPECDVVELLATIAPEVRDTTPHSPQESNGTSSTPEGCPERIIAHLRTLAEERLAKGEGRNDLLFFLCGQIRDNEGTLAQCEQFARGFVELAKGFPRSHRFEVKEALDAAKSAMKGPKREPWQDSLDALASSPGIAAQRSQESRAGGFLIGESRDPEEDGPPPQWEAGDNEGEEQEPQWEGEPRDLDAQEPPPVFPADFLEALDVDTRDLLASVCESFDSPFEVPTLVALSTVSAMALRGVEQRAFPQFKVEPFSIFTMGGVPPDEGKSALLSTIGGPVRKRAAEVLEAAKLAKRRADAAKSGLEELRKATLRKAGKGEDCTAALEDVETRLALLEVPPPRLFYTKDATDAAIAGILESCEGRAALFSAEVPALENLLPIFVDKASAVASTVLSAWSGEDVEQTRTTRVASVEKARMAVCILAQPRILADLISRHVNLAHSGLLSRFLFTCPQSAKAEATLDPRTRPHFPERRVEAWERRMLDLGRWCDSFDNPGLVTFASESQDVLAELIREKHRRCSKGGDWHGPFEDIATRTPKHAARIAVALHLLRHGQRCFERKVSPEDTSAGVALARHSTESWKHFLDGESPARRLALRILEVARGAGGVVAKREIHERLKGGKDYSHREQAFELLASHNLAKSFEVETGGKPRSMVAIHPKARATP